MPDSQDILRLRVLLCFLKDNSKDNTVTGISRILNEEKYKVSRMMIALEKEGMLNRSDARHPVLTENGRKEAVRYSERLEITLNHLLYEGVDSENAMSDAFYWTLYSSDKTIETVRAAEERCRVKYELREQRQFGGGELCKRMRNGTYQFPFLIYRERVKNGSNISMANEGFEHPCILNVKDGIGTIQLRAVEVRGKSAISGKWMRGKVQNLKYFDNGSFVSVEKNADIISFPASVLKFNNIGMGAGQILHGSVCLKMECTAGILHMPESTAIFTMLI